MFCAITGETPEDPVVSKKSGHVFERRVLLKYLENNDNKCPITGQDLSEEDIISVKGPAVVRPRPTTATSLPALLTTFQNEWDALMLETFNLKKELDSAKKELSHALYQHDAACRVIARLIQERDEARAALANLGTSGVSTNSTKQKPSKGSDQMDVDQPRVSGLPDQVVAKLNSKSEELSQGRKKRAISPNLASADEVKEFTVSSTNTIHKANSAGILCVDRHPNDSHAITGGADAHIIVFNRETRKAEANIDAHTKKVTSVLYHPSGDIFFSTSADGTAKVWKNTDQLHVVQVHTKDVVGCSLHSTGDYWATASEDGTWAFHDVRSSQTFFQVKDNAAFQCISFHPDGLILGTGSADNSVKIWDVKSQKVAASFTGHLDRVVDISFSENGYYLATAGVENLVKLWDLRKLSNFHTIDLSKEQFGLECVQFDFSGTYLAVGGADIRIYAGKTFDHITTLSKHTGVVTDVKWGTDAKYLVSAGLDRTLKFWAKKEDKEKTPSKKKK